METMIRGRRVGLHAWPTTGNTITGRVDLDHAARCVAAWWHRQEEPLELAGRLRVSRTTHPRRSWGRRAAIAGLTLISACAAPTAPDTVTVCEQGVTETGQRTAICREVARP